MRIWVDADGLSREINDVLLRVSERRQLAIVRVANRNLPAHASPLVSAVRVDDSFDAADRYIVENLEAGDLVITADVPLAATVVGLGAWALSARGEVFDAGNVGDKLATRDLMSELRSSGAVSGGPASPSPNDRKRFIDALDRLLTKLARQS